MSSHDRANNVLKQAGVLTALALTAVLICLPISSAHALSAKAKRAYVLNAPKEDLQAVGQHLMFGYHAIWQLRPLLERGALGGIFVTDQNARLFKTSDDLKAHITELKSIAETSGTRPLWVAVDQEGGLVSRLSPPLAKPISLQNLIGSPAVTMSGSRDSAVQSHALRKARSLAKLGVNINFAPVVDVRPFKKLRRDRYTVLRRRAISSDPGTIGEVATDYCAAMMSEGVLCTLKHFPGLASVPADTHLRGAKLTKTTEELAKEDWRPFRQVLSQTEAAIMVGHPTLTAVDKTYPVSTSKKAITGILRDDWGFEGLVITDDFYMGAIRRRRGGMGKAAVDALNAGADIVLISRDATELYPVLYDVLKAYQSGRLNKDMLKASRKRLDTASAGVVENRTAAAVAAQAASASDLSSQEKPTAWETQTTTPAQQTAIP